MGYFEQVLAAHEAQCDEILSRWAAGAQVPMMPDRHTDTRHVSFCAAALITALCCPQSRFYQDEEVRRKVGRALRWLKENRRDSGCFDLDSCNFDSAPDTAFTVNALTDAWHLLPTDDSLLPPLTELIERACEGIAAGGFHTPNHRWAISACLLEGAAITGREDFARRAGVYLGEGLDIDESGEFAERSTGVYNLVNDDQMLRLYHLTGGRQYLEAAAQNLRIMRRYFDPDSSVFTFNSRRQDFGATVWPEGYCSLYLLTGFWLKDTDFAATALYLARICAAHGTSPSGLPWLLRCPARQCLRRRARQISPR